MNDDKKIKVTPNGFVWRVLSKEEAKAVWATGVFEVYHLDSDDTEHLIESDEEFDELVDDCTLGIEVGFANRDPSTVLMPTYGHAIEVSFTDVNYKTEIRNVPEAVYSHIADQLADGYDNGEFEASEHLTPSVKVEYRGGWRVVEKPIKNEIV